MLKRTKLAKATVIIAVAFCLSLSVSFASAADGWQIGPDWRIAQNFHVNTVPLPTLPPNGGGQNPQTSDTPTIITYPSQYPSQTITPLPSPTLDLNPTSNANGLFFVVAVVLAIIVLSAVVTQKNDKQSKKLKWKRY